MLQHKIIIWIISISCVLAFFYNNRIDSKVIIVVAWLLNIIGYFNVKSSYNNRNSKYEKGEININAPNVNGLGKFLMLPIDFVNNNEIKWWLNSLNIIISVLFFVAILIFPLPLEYRIISYVIYIYINIFQAAHIRPFSLYIGAIGLFVFEYVFVFIPWLIHNGFSDKYTAYYYVIGNILLVYQIKYMRIKQEKISKKNQFDSDDYSLFISYSSKNAHIARLVAETMLANRLLPWFAEYKVLFPDWFEKDIFLKSIKSGIIKSKYVVLITDDKYMDSEYCQYELEIIKKTKDISKVLHISLSKKEKLHRKDLFFLQLKTIESNENINGIFDAISQLMGAPIRYGHLLLVNRDFKRKLIQYRYFGIAFDYSFDYGLLKNIKFLTNSGKDQSYDITGNTSRLMFSYGYEYEKTIIIGNIIAGIRCFPGRISSDVTIVDNVFIEKAKKEFPNSIKNIEKLAKLDMGKKITDERVAFKLTIIYAEDFLVRADCKQIGIHVFYLHGYSHAVFTYQSVSGAWFRRYSLQFLGNNIDFELAITFHSHCSFIEFSKHIDDIDKFVQSLDIVVYNDELKEVKRYMH